MQCLREEIVFSDACSPAFIREQNRFFHEVGRESQHTVIARFASIQHQAFHPTLNSLVSVPTRSNNTNAAGPVKRDPSPSERFEGSRSAQVGTALWIGNFNNLFAYMCKWFGLLVHFKLLVNNSAYDRETDFNVCPFMITFCGNLPSCF